ncbi:hypothetical protein DFH29DRAFT_763476, partial [Suillus ampliporus]
QEMNSIKAKPKSLGSPARFDTVVVMISEDCESTGLQGARIGRLKVIFRLPTKLYGSWTAPSTWPSEPLAYVEWFTKLKTAQSLIMACILLLILYHW